MDIAITKMSSKGQIVIPAEMRKGFKEGDKLIVISDNDRLVLKKASKVDKQLAEDLEFARRTEEAWKRYEKGLSKKVDLDKMLKELEDGRNKI